MFALPLVRSGSRIGRVAAALASLLLAGCGLFGGDSKISDALIRDLAYVAPDARVVASIEPRVMNDGLREFMRAVDPRLATVVDSMETRFQEETEGLPMDLARDLERVVFFAGDEDRFGLVARGAFEADAMAGFVDRMVPDSALIAGSAAERRWTMGDGSRAVTLSLVAPDLVTMAPGSQPAAPGTGPDDELRTLVTTVGGYPAWLVVRDLPTMPGMPRSFNQRLGRAGQAILSTVRHVAVGTRSENDRLEGVLMLWPADGVVESDLANLVKGAIALVLGDDSLPDELRDRLESIEVDTVGDHVRLRGRVAPGDLQAFVEMGAGLLAAAGKNSDRT